MWNVSFLIELYCSGARDCHTLGSPCRKWLSNSLRQEATCWSEQSRDTKRPWKVRDGRLACSLFGQQQQFPKIKVFMKLKCIALVNNSLKATSHLWTKCSCKLGYLHCSCCVAPQEWSGYVSCSFWSWIVQGLGCVSFWKSSLWHMDFMVWMLLGMGGRITAFAPWRVNYKVFHGVFSGH